MATLPDARDAQPAHPRAQERAELRGDDSQNDPRAAGRNLVREQHRRIVDQLETRFPEAAALLEEAAPDPLAFTSLTKEHWRQLWSNNSLERLNKEIHPRTDVVGIFPDRASIMRLIGAVLTEQSDEWAVASRRYMSVESLAKALVDPADAPEDVMAIPAAA